MMRFAASLIFAVSAFAQTAVFPGAVATDANLGVAVNRTQQVLKYAVGTTNTTLYLVSTTGFVANSIATVDGGTGSTEEMWVCAVNSTANTLTIGKSACPNVDGRGVDGTTAHAHNPGSFVTSGVWIAPWLTNSPDAEIKAIEGALGTNLSKVHAGQYYFAAGVNGAVCDGTTDDTAALNALIVTVQAAGGGEIIVFSGTSVCKIAGQITIANTGGGFPTQQSITIRGVANSANGYWGALPSGPSTLDLTYNAPYAKVLSLGANILNLYDLTLKDSGSDCAAFVQITNTTAHIERNTFSGTRSGTSACNDAIILGGGTVATVGSDPTDAFQGYKPVVSRNFFDKTRLALRLRTFANDVAFRDNTISSSSGSNQTGAISTCTQASPTVCTIQDSLGASPTFSATQTFPLRISGFTGNWTPINGDHTCTRVTATTCSIAVDARGFGAVAGTPVYLNGSVLRLDGGASTVNGLISQGNTVEMTNYPFYVRATDSTGCQYGPDGLYDQSSAIMIAGYWFGAGADQNRVTTGFFNDQNPLVAEVALTNDIDNSHQSQMSVHAWPHTFQSGLYLNNRDNPGYGLYQYDQNAAYWQWQTSVNGSNNRYHLVFSGFGDWGDFWSASPAMVLRINGAPSRVVSLNGDLQLWSAVGSSVTLGDGNGASAIYTESTKKFGIPAAGNYKVGTTDGASATVTVKGSAGANCDLVYVGGLFASTTCP